MVQFEFHENSLAQRKAVHKLFFIAKKRKIIIVKKDQLYKNLGPYNEII